MFKPGEDCSGNSTILGQLVSKNLYETPSDLPGDVLKFPLTHFPFSNYILGQIIVEKLSKLHKIGFSVKYFGVDFCNFLAQLSKSLFHSKHFRNFLQISQDPIIVQIKRIMHNLERLVLEQLVKKFGIPVNCRFYSTQSGVYLLYYD